MILTCPACGTQYVVKDGAIPEGGRKVRCASCRHSWHQDAPPLDLDEAIDTGVAVPAGEGEYPPQPLAGPATLPDAAEAWDEGEAVEDLPVDVDADLPPAPPVEGSRDWDEAAEQAEIDHLAEERAAVAPVEPDPIVPVAADAPVDDFDEFSPFAARDEAEPSRRRPWVAILVVVILVAAAAAAFWFLAPPELKARVGLADSRQTPLQLMMTSSDREALASGNELLAVSGRVINPTTKSQPVPPIQAELRSKTGQVVYRWTIAPPTPVLAPGASARFNSAEVNVPAGGEELTVSLGAPSA